MHIIIFLVIILQLMDPHNLFKNIIFPSPSQQHFLKCTLTRGQKNIPPLKQLANYSDLINS